MIQTSPAVLTAFAASAILTTFAVAPASAQKSSALRTAQPKPAVSTRYLTTGDARKLADRAITPAQLKDYLSFIASDELQGRDTPSNGLNTAAKFLATNLSRWGFKPAGDSGTFFQKIPLSRTRVDSGKTQATLGTRPLVYLDDFVLVGGRGRAAADITDAPLVFAGQGWVLPKKNVNPYAGIDVKGKTLVISQRPAQRFPSGPDYANAVSPQQYAAAQGAAGIVYLVDAAAYSQIRTDAATPRGGFSLAATPASTSSRRPSTPSSVILSPEASQRLFAGEKIDLAAALALGTSEAGAPSFDFTGAKKMSLAVRYTTETETTQNVVAVWEGSDPKLKSEYVAFGAHYDHVGMSTTPDASGDSIFNGADDDGSGTSALLAIADALHQSSVRPRRSLLFVWHCGEEKGLWGSSYFTSNPTVPLNRIAAQLNIDMIGRSKQPGNQKPSDANLSGPNEIYVIGSRMMSTQLGNLSDRVNKGYKNLKLNYTFDDPNDPNQFFYRSDHINYARKGIPIIFWFDGVHEDYHRRSDEVSKIDFTKMTAVTRTVFATAAEIADLPQKIVVDKKLTLPERE